MSCPLRNSQHLEKIWPKSEANSASENENYSKTFPDAPANNERPERTGRPIGDNDFIEKLEKITGRHLKPRKPGPKPKAVN